MAAPTPGSSTGCTRSARASASPTTCWATRAFADVPFFWTHQYDLELRVTGHLAGWDELRIEGSPAARDFIARYYRWGTLVAAATVGRDLANLELEAELAAA